MSRLARKITRPQLKKGMKNHVKALQETVKAQEKELESIKAKAMVAVKGAAEEGFTVGFGMGRESVGVGASQLEYGEGYEV